MLPPHLKFKGFTVCFLVRLHNALAFSLRTDLYRSQISCTYWSYVIVRASTDRTWWTQFTLHIMYFSYLLWFLHNYCDRMLYVTNLMVLDYWSYVIDTYILHLLIVRHEHEPIMTSCAQFTLNLRAFLTVCFYGKIVEFRLLISLVLNMLSTITTRLLINMGEYLHGRLHQYWMQIAWHVLDDRTWQEGTDVMRFYIMWRHVPTTP
jgi:hypothetical protein